MSTNRRILAVIRRPDDLYALLSARNARFEPPAPGPLGAADPYMQTTIALRALPDDMLPWRDKDVATWERLGSITALDAAAGLMIVRIVLATVADPAYQAVVPFGRRAPFDLRPALCSDEDQLLEEMRPLLEALAADASLGLPAWHWKRRDELRAMPTPFRVAFLWTLSLAPWDHVTRAARSYASLGLNDDAPLRRCVAHLFSITPAETALAWCELVKRIAPHRRAHAIELTIESGGYAREPSAAHAAAVTHADVADADYPSSVFAALRQLS